MADVVITPADVLYVSGNVEALTLGEAMTAGQSYYIKAADGKAYKADANSGTAEVRVLKGVLLNGGAAGQPAKGQTSGEIDIGGTVVVGTVYVLSATAGGIAPWADLLSGEFVSVLGVGVTATNLKMLINNSGVAKP